MNKKIIISLVSILGISLLAYFYLFQNKSTKLEDSNNIVRVGYMPIYVDMPVFVAKEKGFFERNNVEVEFIRFESSPDMGTAIVNNNIDAASSIATSVVLTIESRDPDKVEVFAVDAPNKENYLSSFITLKESGIESISDLKGKNIGSFPGPTAVKFGQKVLKTVNLEFGDDYSWVELPVNTHITALRNKTIDALFTYEPTATQAVMENSAIKIAPGAIETHILDPWQAGSWLVSKKSLNEKPDLIKRYVKAIYEAIDYMRDQNSKDQNKYKDALLPYTSVKIDIANNTPDIPFTKIGEVDLEQYQKYSDMHTEMGLLSKRIDIRQLFLNSDLLNDN